MYINTLAARACVVASIRLSETMVSALHNSADHA
jgi:hypothetical protein